MRRLYSLLSIVMIGMNINAQRNDTHSNTLLITEVCVANIDQTIDYSNNYGSWVELYNPTATNVSLDGLFISNDSEELTKHRLSGYGVLKPGCYQCIFFDHNAADGEYGQDAEMQVRFKLNRNGGIIYLSKNGVDVDLSITYPESVPRCSYARVNTWSDEWQYCGEPTPGLPNAGHYAQDRLSIPEVDCDSRLFTSQFDVHVQIPARTTLRYTTDGSTPTLTNGHTSPDGLFTISTNTVLRLRLFADDKLPSSVVTRTYIYRDRNYYLPIVAVTSDPRNLYDDIIGCYVNGKNGIAGRGSIGKSNLNMDWERPVNFEYLTPDGKMVINQETSFEVAGGYSRHFEPASFKVQAKKLYDGNGHFAYPVFTNKPYQEYKQLLIRNGGNNNRTDGGPRIKDAITQQVLTTSGFYVDAQEYQPVHVFINGKYLAMMNVREPNNRFHGAANYGYDDDEMDGFEYSSGGYHQKSGTPEVFDRLIQMSYEAYSDEVYERMRELLDIDEFVRYMATICYTGSYDWLYTNNNVKGYRSLEDGKFHFVLFDQDLTWERTNNVETINGVNTNEVLILYNNLKQNRRFRNQFVTAYCILNGSIYTPERCMYIADSICALIKDALSFDNRSTAITYRKLQETMWEKKHREERIQSLMHAYALPNSIYVNIGTNCAFACIQIEGIDVPFSKFSGELFGPISVKTNSAEGYRFIGWADQQGRWVNHEKTIQIRTKGTYIAVFERATENVSPLCINEISAANNIYVNDYGKRADWIELYNRCMEPIDVSQWYFSTDEKGSKQYQINAANNVNTIIQPNEHMIVWCDEKPSVSELHLPFKLKNNDNNTLILQSSDGNWKDSIHYNSHSSKETVGRYPNGGNDCWVFYHPTIGTHNLTTSYDHEVSIDTIGILPPSFTPSKKAIYNLQGQRINALQKGLNIVDGKKVFVR